MELKPEAFKGIMFKAKRSEKILKKFVKYYIKCIKS